MNRTHRYLMLAGVFGITSIGAAITSVAEKSNSDQAFEKLASLIGEWRGVQEGDQANSEIKLTYTLTANGSVLMEESKPAGEGTMITMFTVDGDHLIATHYCIARNQPQMVTKPITEPPTKSLIFSLARVTGMKSSEDWHNTGVTVTMEDGNHLTQVWTYEYKGKKGTNTFHFTRIS
jgi:hypothetical protein